MNIEQGKMQFLGVFGIYTEACKIIFSGKKIFTQITLAFIFTLTFIFIAEIEISNIISAKLIHNEIVIIQTQSGTPKFDKVLHGIKSEWIAFILFKIAYMISFVILSLFYTSAVVYTVACVYTDREITFGKVMSVVPKVWKRVMATFLSIFSISFACNMVAVGVVLLYYIFSKLKSNFYLAIFIVFCVIYLVGTFYMSVIWCLSNVVSVLEDACGFSAMKKSKELLRGKMLVTSIIIFQLSLLFLVVQFSYAKIAVSGASSLNVVSRIAFGLLCFLLLAASMLFGLVVQTVLYFVCKSYHNENIDKSALSAHLEVYHGEYVPLKAKDVQVEHLDV